MNESVPEVTLPESQVSAERLEYLREEVARQLAVFGRRRRRDKRKAFSLQMATVSLSAAITVLLGLRTADLWRPWLLNIALVLGALVTVCAAAEAFFTHRGLWVLRTITVRRLEALARHLDFYKSGMNAQQVDSSILSGCLSELDRIIADDQQAWLHLRETSPTRDPSGFSIGDISTDSSTTSESPDNQRHV